MQFYIHFCQENCINTFFTGKASPSQDDCPSTKAAMETGIIYALWWSLMFCLSAEGFHILSSHLAAATSLPGVLLSVYPHQLNQKSPLPKHFQAWMKIATSLLATSGRWLPLLSADSIHSSPMSPGEHSLAQNTRLHLNISTVHFDVRRCYSAWKFSPLTCPNTEIKSYIMNMKSQISNNYHRF